MTRSAGTKGFTRAGSPPRAASAARIAAGAADPGTPAEARTLTPAGPNGGSGRGDPRGIGIVGGGGVGRARGGARARAGGPIGAVASGDAGRGGRFRSLVPGAGAFAEATAVLDEAELIILAVPDDAIAGLA